MDGLNIEHLEPLEIKKSSRNARAAPLVLVKVLHLFLLLGLLPNEKLCLNVCCHCCAQLGCRSSTLPSCAECLMMDNNGRKAALQSVGASPSAARASSSTQPYKFSSQWFNFARAHLMLYTYLSPGSSCFWADVLVQLLFDGHFLAATIITPTHLL